MKVRGSWLVCLAAVVVVFATPSLREQVGVLLSARSYYGAAWGTRVEAYRGRAAEFAQRHVPRDPELLLGAGLLTGSQERAHELLRQAAEEGKSPAAWAAYARQVVEELPRYALASESGLDPAEPGGVAAAKKWVQEQRAEGIPEGLLPEDIEPAMAVLQQWEKVDPGNGMALAYEARLLAAVGKRPESLAHWEAAARAPRLDLYTHAQAVAAERLLTSMGMPGPEAAANADAWIVMPELFGLRSIARVAQYEGSLARVQGRGAEAIRWWRATSTVGHTLQASAEERITYLIGSAIESIGAAPSWRWYPAEVVGEPRERGVLLGGLMFYGRHHDWYVQQVGAEEDRRLRDRLIEAKTRAALLRKVDNFVSVLRERMRWVLPSTVALAGFGTATLYFVLFLCFGLWGRQETDAASRLSPPAAFLLALVAFAPLAAGLIYAPVHGDPFGPKADQLLQAVGVGSIVTFAAALLLPFVVAGATRVSGFSLFTTGRANLRRVLPIVVALGMLFGLAFGFETARQRRAYVLEWRRTGFPGLAHVKAQFGGQWEHPTIPAGAWRAEYPVVPSASTPTGAAPLPRPERP